MAFRTNKTPVLQTKSASGAIATFNTALAMPLVNGEFTIQAYQEGSGEPSPDNVRNFVPFNKLRIGMVNFNQLNANSESTSTGGGVTYTNNNDGTWTLTNNGTGVYRKKISPVNCVVDHKYYMTTGASIEGSSSTFYVCLTKSGAYINESHRVGGSIINARFEYDAFSIRTFDGFVPPENGLTLTPQLIDLTQAFGSRIADYLYSLEQNQVGSGVALFKQLFYKDYYDYNVGGTWVSVASVNGDSYPDYAEVELGEDVYGGSYNSVSGVKRKTKVSIDLGDLTWLKYTNGVFYNNAVISDANISKAVICDIYKYNYNALPAARGDKTINLISYYGTKRISIYDEDLLDLTPTEFKTYVTGHKCVYELETPIESNIGSTPIEPLIGNNTIFADTGDIDLTYKDLDIAKRGNFREVFRLPS